MTKRKRYKRYSPEFKREALKRAAQEGVTDVIVCFRLDNSFNTDQACSISSAVFRNNREKVL